MKSYDVTVLIVDDQTEMRNLWAEVITPIAQVACAASVRDALPMIPGADILVLDWQLGDGNGSVLLDRWMRDVGGPCCVISGEISQQDLYHLFGRGVYNALQKPIPIEALTAIMRHYVQDVRMAHQIRDLSTQMAKLRRNMLLLALVLAAVAGPEIIRYVGMVV